MKIFLSGGEFGAGRFLPEAVMPESLPDIMMTYMYIRDNKKGKGSSLFRRRMKAKARSKRKKT